MKSEPNIGIEQYRRTHPFLGPGHPGTNIGYFVKGRLRIISSGSQKGWEHVSVSAAIGGLPTWDEMCEVKDMFWNKNETVVQFHPKLSEYVNFHPGVLHLWKEIKNEYTLPPKEFIA